MDRQAVISALPHDGFAVGPPENRGRIRKVVHWFKLRSVLYVCWRFVALLQRYGLTASRAKRRTLRCVETLARYDCRPTFPTPGQVVHRNGAFCRELQRRGAELAIHGYHHLDFRALSADEARTQFARATSAYERNGIQPEGFRCPYLSYVERVNWSLPPTLEYSSNKAIQWDVVRSKAPRRTDRGARAVFEGLSRFYQPAPSRTHVSVPSMAGQVVEIPVSVPDDLQLLDGLKLDAAAMTEAWIDLLHQTHRRGELFDVLFHPESFDRSGPVLEAVLREARDLRPAVWVTQLRDLNRWWREKSGFAVDTVHEGASVRLEFRCSERATVLTRQVDTSERVSEWDGSYRVLESRTLHLNASGKRPFVGVAADPADAVVAFLRNQGYIVETGAAASECATFLGSTELTRVPDQVQLLELIESAATPLVRFWRWPSHARSALCVTGDLDALSLTDYAARLFAL
jgi:peptidoglycan/xylan/chitin deacetylase (PgdA/CDA1 family)